MKIVSFPDDNTLLQLSQRPVYKQEDLAYTVKQVFDEVKLKGDSALLGFTEKFDNVKLTSGIELLRDEWHTQAETISETLKEAIQLAMRNIEKFHKSQVNDTPQKINIREGVVCWQESRPIEKVGIYIPGGSAPLFSTVLMLAVPATIAGCQEIILCTPPDKNGNIHPAILYAAKIAGVHKVMRLGGIQAIAALSIGTVSVPAVYKIFGPGNQYVTAAKQYAFSLGTAIDLPAGPSELMVVADDTADAEFVAADLLSQAEHGADSQVVCVTTSEIIAQEIAREVMAQLALLPRKAIAEKALENSAIIVLQQADEILKFINLYAPEHLIMACRNYDWYVNKIQNAGSVFLGNYTPESAGDYASGTNHTLPTNGFAKMYSGVNMDAFYKKITFQEISAQGIRLIGNAIEIMAENEELFAHKNAVTLRLNKLKNNA
jgi:histidinol dehydrogenase